MTTKVKVAITAGDLAGVSGTVILKALADPEIAAIDSVIYGDHHFFESLSAQLKRERIISEDVTFRCYDPLQHGFSTDILGNSSAETGYASGYYFERAIGDALSGEISAIATAPLNKEMLQLGGYPDTGHTSMLKRLTGSREVVMMLYGAHLKVALLTIHLPINRVAESITREGMIDTVEIVVSDLKRYFQIPDPKVAIMGINPHAGENGCLGREEQEIMIPAIEELRQRGVSIEGPFPADTYFYRTYQQFDVTIAAYHDQGLIPLKMLHFDDGVNWTMGSQIIRTSVDHGTAIDLATQFHKISERSMVEAIKEAHRMGKIREEERQQLREKMPAPITAAQTETA